jgi:peroxiredoxin
MAVLALLVCSGMQITDPSMSGAQPAPTKKADTHAPVSGIQELKIGDAAPDFSLPGIDGKTHSLAEYREAKVLMIVFLSNHCPDSHAAQGRILKLAAEMKDKGLVVVAINPNNPDGLSIDELGYSKYSDSFEDMKKYAADTKLTIPYLYDGEKQTVARAYGCLATPHVSSSMRSANCATRGSSTTHALPRKAPSILRMPATRSWRCSQAGRCPSR